MLLTEACLNSKCNREKMIQVCGAACKHCAALSCPRRTRAAQCGCHTYVPWHGALVHRLPGTARWLCSAQRAVPAAVNCQPHTRTSKYELFIHPPKRRPPPLPQPNHRP